MRIVQRNKEHEGYALYKICENTEIRVQMEPLFTQDLLLEAHELLKLLTVAEGKEVICIGIYSVNVIMLDILEQIKNFKRTYGIIPQNYTEELRTGARTEKGLIQSLPRFFYK